VIDLRQETATAQLLSPRKGSTRIVTIGNRLADRGDLFVMRRLLLARSIDTELGLDLSKSALGAFECKGEFARLQSDQDIPDAHFAAELDRHVDDDACDLTADTSLVGGDQSSRQVDASFDADSLQRCRFNPDASSATSAPAAISRSVGLTRRGVASESHGSAGQCEGRQHN
jgi:hypothetical protein